MALHELADQIVRAAVVEDRSFADLLPRLRQASETASPTELNAAIPRMAEGIAAAPPNLGGWLAVVTGAWVESGADPGAAGEAVVHRTTDVTSGALTFASAWEEATGGRPPDMRAARPSPHVVGTVAPGLGDRAVAATRAWFALPQYTKAGCTMLQRAPSVRGGLADRDFRAFAAGQAAQYLPLMDHFHALLRVLDGERLLVLHRASRRGWTVTVGGIGDNVQLHVLLAGALIGRADGPAGDRPASEIVACFRDADAPPGPPVVSGPWNLVDAHGAGICDEGVPADVPAVNGTRVVVIDPPSRTRTFPAGRRFPLMPATLRVDTAHPPEELIGWWSHIAPPGGTCR